MIERVGVLGIVVIGICLFLNGWAPLRLRGEVERRDSSYSKFWIFGDFAAMFGIYRLLRAHREMYPGRLTRLWYWLSMLAFIASLLIFLFRYARAETVLR